MRVLYVTNKPIYPTIDGGTVAMKNFLECLLNQQVDVKHLFLHTPKHPLQTGAYPSNVREAIQPEGVSINTKVTVWGAFYYLFKKGSYNISRFLSSRMTELIKDTLQNDHFDCVLLDSLYMTLYTDTIRSCFKGKIYLRTHNVEYKIWSDLAVNTKNLIKKIYLHKLAYDLKRYEYKALNKMDGILTLSKKDSAELANWNISVAVKTVPVAITTDLNKSNSCENTNFFHLGSMNWQPNIEAVQRLVKLFPKIKKELPEAELHIAGSNNVDSIKASNENGIFIDGYVSDLSEYCKKIGILVSPIQSGSGIRIKILEMMALGIPVITTDIGAQGIDHRTSDCIVIANTETEIVQACIELATDDTKRNEIAFNGMNYIRKNHNIDTISKEIIEFIQNK